MSESDPKSGAEASGTDVFIGRQPIVDRNEHIVAYELLFRGSATATFAEFGEARIASVRVMANAFASMDIDEVLGSNRGFFNVTSEVVFSDMVEALPSDRVVIELLEDIPVTPELIQRCRELKAAGFRLALDDWELNDPRKSLLDHVHIVKVDLPAIPDAELPRVVRTLRRKVLGLLAEKVETREQFERCLDLGFDLFQGYFFAKPEVLSGSTLDPARATLLQVMQQIQADADTVDIANTLKMHVNLGVSMLRLVNSAGMGRLQKIGCIEDAVAFLGQRQVWRWVALLLFAADDSSLESPLLQTAAHRGRLMELLSKQMHAGAAVQSDRAFLVGMLSLIDALLNRPLEDILPELHLDDAVNDGIMKGEGALGTLLKLVRHLEADEFDAVEGVLAQLGIGLSELQEADNQAYAWVHGLVAGSP